MLDSLFAFYTLDGGWVAFLGFAALIFLIVLVDNQLNRRSGFLWLLFIFLCLLTYVPIALYDLGSPETASALGQRLDVIFYAGLLGAIAPILLAVGYWFSSRPVVRPIPMMADHNFNQMAQAGNLAPAPMMPQMPNMSPAGFDFGNSPTQMDGGGMPPMGGYNPPPMAGGFGASESPTILPDSNYKPQANVMGGREKVLVWLKPLNTPNAQMIQLYRGNNRIGRNRDFEVYLADQTVTSKGSAQITTDSTSLIIQDMGDPYGVKVNGYRLEGKADLYHGSIISVGKDVRFEVIIGGTK